MYTAHSGTPQASRRQYSSDRLETASNARILTLCFDRLDRDLTVARDALGRSAHFEVNEALGHAQDLLGEVATMLDVAVWEHAPSLLAIYDYVLRLIAKANILKEDALLAEAQHLLAEIGGAFRTAAGDVQSSATTPVPETDLPSPRISLRA